MCKARLTIILDFKDNSTEKLRELVAKLEEQNLQTFTHVEARHITPVDIATWALGSDDPNLKCDVHYSEIHDMA